MAEFKLGRIRFVWKNEWATSTTYYKDDVVRYGGKIYICVIGHEASADFFTDFDIIPPKWNLVSDGQSWQGAWTTGTSYIVDDIVSYGARLYICNTAHTSQALAADGLEADIANWTVFAEGLDWTGDWTVATRYKVNDVVKYGGSVYVCNTAHTSQADAADGLEADVANWDLLNQGIDYKYEWVAATRYKVNDVIRYGSGLWICTGEHTASAAFATDSANWEKFVEGFQYEGEWDAYTPYQEGDVVRYGGNTYIALTSNVEKKPAQEASDWRVFSQGIRFLGDWGEDSTAYEYRTGEVVRQGAYTYICIQDHTNQQPPNATYWQRLNSGLEWRGVWLDDQEYYLGDVVRYGANTYICVLGHISEGDDFSTETLTEPGGGAENSRPDLDTSGTYWNILSIGKEEDVLTTTGDLVYYTGSGPARLPIGQNGQVLTVGANNLPEWATLGSANDVYWVAEHGVDSPAPIYGKTIDRPFKTIRYACEQVEKGTKNPNAARLLEMNRQFIQREIVEWTDYQITNDISPFTSAFAYQSAKCERDMGYIVDALIWDITHGGNYRTRKAALAYVNDTVGSPYLTQKDETKASIVYGLEVIEAVLNQTAPSTNYQVTNGDNSTAIVDQYTETGLAAEDVLANITSLVGIITDAITAGVEDDIPAEDYPTSLIRVSTGKYYEVLPIIVPRETCVMGDELRATNVNARTKYNQADNLTPVGDTKFSFEGIKRMEKVLGDVVRGYTVDATTGNTQTQVSEYPLAEAPQETSVGKLARVIRRNIDYGVNAKIEWEKIPVDEFSDANYGYARNLIVANREFILDEMMGFLADTDDGYPDLKYSRTKCRRDASYLIDAVLYDLTYSGNWMSVEAGKAYFDGASNNLQINSTEKTATLAAYAYLKSLLQTVARNITVNPTYQTDTVQLDGTAGSIGASNTIGSLMDDVITVIRDGYDNAPVITYPTTTGANTDLVAASTALTNASSTIQTSVIDFISKHFGNFTYNSSKCRRDLDYIISDTAYDVALGTNYNAVNAGLSYTRANAYTVLNGQLTETIGALNYARDLIEDELSDSTAITRHLAAWNEVTDILENGSGNADSLSFPAPSTLPSTNATDAKDQLIANKAYIQAEIVAWIDDQIAANASNPPSPWYNFTYDSDKCSRDTGYIVDAMCFDIQYGGTLATTRVAQSYFVDGNTQIYGQSEQTALAYDRLATVLDEIVREQNVTESSGNGLTQDTSGTAATSTEGNALLAKMQIIEDVITAGNLDDLPAIVYPDLAALNVSATLQSEKAAIDSAEAQVILDTIQYINTTFNTEFNYDQTKCMRDINLIVDACRYDFVLDTNFASMIAAHSYLRLPAAEVLGAQKDATIAALEYARPLAIDAVATNPGAIAGINKTWDFVTDMIFGGDGNGANIQTDENHNYSAIRHLELNKDFIVQEVHSHVTEHFKGSITETVQTGGVLTTSDTSWMSPWMPVKFVNIDDSTDSVTNAGLQEDVTYYVKDIESSTTFTLADSVGGTLTVVQDSLAEFDYDKAKCTRDTGYILDGVAYDVALGTNYNSVYNGIAYQRASGATVTADQLAQTIAGINHAKSKVGFINAVRTSTTAQTRADAGFDEVIDILQNGTVSESEPGDSVADSLSFPAPTGASANTQNAVAQLIANRAFLQAEVTQYIADNYGALVYDSDKCERDVGYLIDALCYDIMYGGNSASVRAAQAYFVGAASQLGAGQQLATIAAYNYLASAAGFVVVETTSDVGTGFPLQVGVSQDTSGTAASATEATLVADLLQITEDVITDGDLDGLPTIEYPDVSWAAQALQDAQVAIYANKKDIQRSVIRYLDNTYGKLFTVEKAYDYNMALCTRDINAYIDAIKADMMWPQEFKREYNFGGTNDLTIHLPGCYKTRLAARYYVNAVIGSQEEDFYYMRNNTGLRLQTLDGLRGDLGAPNAYGTSRPTAGAYASLDPGWGSAHEAVWINSRSPYMQNCSCFGYACIGQKIDGALHDGGNDSMVSNDFTQLMGDGIGAWITNNGRAELVSVFTYYSHIGYLAENGGRIRATNGNNSYGDFGSVAEGVDPDETPVLGAVDNISQYNAVISSVVTNQDQLLVAEFSHAGNDYTKAQIDFFGAGDNEEIYADEFRDDGIFEVKLLDLDDSSGEIGGDGYTVVQNTAQDGSTTSISLAATDGASSTAYIGMKVLVTGGAGIGQYALIDTYDSGTKIAEVVRESDGQAGWDHFVPGTTIVAPNSSSTYEIEPAIDIAAPPKSNGTITLSSSQTWVDVKYIETSEQFTGVSGTPSGNGLGTTFDVTRTGSKYYVSINAAGTGHLRLETITIDGSNLGGATSINDLVITITSVDVNGGVTGIDFNGVGQKGKFLAISDTTTVAATSIDGETWSAETLPTAGSGTWSSIASGLLDDGSSDYFASSVVVVADGSSNVAYSADADTWSSTTLPGGLNTGAETRVAFGNVALNDNRYVVISSADRDVAYSVDAGATWSLTTDALPGIGYDSITFGKGLFVAVQSNSTNAAWSEDGITWTGVTLPSTAATVNDIAFGNNRFVTLGSTNGTMYSLDGKNWTNGSLALPLTATERKIAYGQGVFVITSDDTNEVQWSQDGIYWQSYTITTITGGYNACAFGNPNRVGKFVLLPNNAGTGGAYARIGAKAIARVGVASEKIFEIRLQEPGSCYDDTSLPTVTVTDPGNIYDINVRVRIGKGVLANPTYINRGTGYLEATADVNAENSNGGADFIQYGSFIAVKRLTARPVPGSNVVFDGLDTTYKLVNIISFVGEEDGSYTAFLNVSPEVTVADEIADNATVTCRIRYSQVRLTGHDFLDIGTGNFTKTNYPNAPLVDPDPDDETLESNGGRVFFTATDQDGNFRVGNLFSVEQATGVATLDAEAFNIAGLQELSLGEVTLGGNSAAVNEFSTDPFMTANSDNVVPTQRAVKAYIEAQIGGGGASLNVNTVTAGDIFIGSNIITTASGQPINISGTLNFTGGITGYPLAINYMLR
jgi:hypothetical protein